MIDLQRITFRLDGYAATGAAGEPHRADQTTDQYASEQLAVNTRKTLEFVLPIIEGCGARSVADIGCGMGTMVSTLLERGYDAYGIDVAGVSQRWSLLGLPRERFVIVDPGEMRLPFADGQLDFMFSLGVIEHVGTADGHAERLPGCHDVRRRWLREMLRCVRPGGHLLVGGPNRNFPVDVAHGPDCDASALERLLSRLAGATVHKTWGANFLWSYRDFAAYLEGERYALSALNVHAYVGYSRVPALLRPLVKGYVRHLPRALLASGLNPWVMALIRKGPP